MFRYLYVVIILLLAAMLFAEPEFYPMTQVGEAFLNTSNAVCNDAVAGLNIVEDQFHNGEFFSMRYYSQSTGLSNPFSEARVDYYDITAFPTVIFNGTEEIIGGGPSIINGSEYAQLINQNRFAPSPIMMQVIDFNSFYGTLAVTVTMKSSTYSIQNQSIHFVLVQNGLPTEPTNIIREVITQPITLSGLNSNVSFNVNFDTEIYGIVPEYWVAAFVQLDNGSILQAVSILSQPTYQIRAAMPFSPTIIDSANINYNSETVWFYNLGQADNYTIRLLPDNNPADWYLNYCNETGGCFPGDIPNPFSLASGEVIGFHLNLLVGNSGTSTFHFIVESPNISPYIVPFTYQTENTPNDDQFVPETNVQLLQNYPNPFTNETTFCLYTRQTSQPVEIEIFNPKGQKVKVLNTGILKTGTSTITWNGTDLKGRKLPQGIYYSRIRNDNKSKTIKMLIMNNK